MIDPILTKIYDHHELEHVEILKTSRNYLISRASSKKEGDVVIRATTFSSLKNPVKNEAVFLDKFSYPEYNFPTLYHFQLDWENLNPYVIKEYIPGTTLDNLKTEDIPLEELRKTINLIEKFHKMGYSGFDPILENLVLTKDKGIRMFDFGEIRFQNEHWRLYDLNRLSNLERYFCN